MAELFHPENFKGVSETWLLSHGKYFIEEDWDYLQNIMGVNAFKIKRVARNPIIFDEKLKAIESNILNGKNYEELLKSAVNTEDIVSFELLAGKIDKNDILQFIKDMAIDKDFCPEMLKVLDLSEEGWKNMFSLSLVSDNRNIISGLMAIVKLEDMVEFCVEEIGKANVSDASIFAMNYLAILNVVTEEHKKKFIIKVVNNGSIDMNVDKLSFVCQFDEDVFNAVYRVPFPKPLSKGKDILAYVTKLLSLKPPQEYIFRLACKLHKQVVLKDEQDFHYFKKLIEYSTTNFSTSPAKLIEGLETIAKKRESSNVFSEYFVPLLMTFELSQSQVMDILRHWFDIGENSEYSKFVETYKNYDLTESIVEDLVQKDSWFNIGAKITALGKFKITEAVVPSLIKLYTKLFSERQTFLTHSGTNRYALDGEILYGKEMTDKAIETIKGIDSNELPRFTGIFSKMKFSSQMVLSFVKVILTKDCNPENLITSVLEKCYRDRSRRGAVPISSILSELRTFIIKKANTTNIEGCKKIFVVLCKWGKKEEDYPLWLSTLSSFSYPIVNSILLANHFSDVPVCQKILDWVEKRKKDNVSIGYILRSLQGATDEQNMNNILELLARKKMKRAICSFVEKLSVEKKSQYKNIVETTWVVNDNVQDNSVDLPLLVLAILSCLTQIQ